MRKNKLLTKVVSTVVACAMVMTFANAHAVQVEAKENPGHEVVLTLASESTDKVEYKLYCNKTYKIVNTTDKDAPITTIKRGDKNTSYEIVTDNPTNVERYGFVNVNGSYAAGVLSPNGIKTITTINNYGTDEYEIISVPVGVTVEESDSPALYKYELKYGESCLLNNPTEKRAYLQVYTSENETISDVKVDWAEEHNVWDARSEAKAYELLDNSQMWITHRYSNEKSNAIIAIPYDAYENGVTIEKSDKPALYHVNVENNETIVINSNGNRKYFNSLTGDARDVRLYDIANYNTYDFDKGTISVDNVIDKRPYDTYYNYIIGNIKEDTYKEVITVKYNADEQCAADIAIPYMLIEEGVYIEKREAPAFYKINVKPGSILKFESVSGNIASAYVNIFGESGSYVYKGQNDDDCVYNPAQVRATTGYIIQVSENNTEDVLCCLPYDLVYDGSIIVSLDDEILSVDSNITGDIIAGNRNEMVTESDGKKYWYENGIKQGTEGRGKEIYDPETDAWYWLDAIQGGAVAISKDVYQESNGGKWVRYDADGHMVKGWDTNENGTYYFDPITGAMAKGVVNIFGTDYRFDENTGTMLNLVFVNDNGNDYWYENGIKQGTEGRGREIYDPATDAWYWLDAIDGGKKATSKDVYQESNGGKWVRYDADGHMIKGWQTNENGTYYFDLVTGAMAKGKIEIDEAECYFSIDTGILQYIAISIDATGTYCFYLTKDI